VWSHRISTTTFGGVQEQDRCGFFWYLLCFGFLAMDRAHRSYVRVLRPFGLRHPACFAKRGCATECLS
jgi:hypothetical protein